MPRAVSGSPPPSTSNAIYGSCSLTCRLWWTRRAHRPLPAGETGVRTFLGICSPRSPLDCVQRSTTSASCIMQLECPPKMLASPFWGPLQPARRLRAGAGWCRLVHHPLPPCLPPLVRTRADVRGAPQVDVQPSIHGAVLSGPVPSWPHVNAGVVRDGHRQEGRVG